LGCLTSLDKGKVGGLMQGQDKEQFAQERTHKDKGVKRGKRIRI